MTLHVFDPVWINQPSTQQPDHKLHGANALILQMPPGDDFVDILVLAGNVPSQRIHKLALAAGWKPWKDALPFEQTAELLKLNRKLFDRAEEADHYEQWLEQIGQSVGCKHVDEALVSCVTRFLLKECEERQKMQTAIDGARNYLAVTGGCGAALADPSIRDAYNELTRLLDAVPQ